MDPRGDTDIHHLQVGAAGESRWRDVAATLAQRRFAPPADGIEVTETVRATGMLFRRLRAGWDEPIHPTPVAQTLIRLRGGACG